MIRAFVDDTGEGGQALDWYREHHRICPLASGPDPDATCVSFSQHPYLRTTHVRDVTNFERLAEVVQREPSGVFTAYWKGLLKAVGIEKGVPHGQAQPPAPPAARHSRRQLLVRDPLPPRNPLPARQRSGQTREEQPRRPGLGRRRVYRSLLRPRASLGDDRNWIRTLPDQGWQTLVRLYGPLET